MRIRRNSALLFTGLTTVAVAVVTLLGPPAGWAADKLPGAKPVAKPLAKPVAKPLAAPLAASPAKPAAKTAAKSAATKSTGKKSAKKVKEEAAPERMPWSLREHYTFSGGALRLDYSKVDAEWRLRVDKGIDELQNPEILVRDVGFTIELADGRILKHDELGLRESTLDRESFTHEVLGTGCYYTVHFVPKDGLAVSYRLAALNNWPFLTLTLMIRNDSEAPVEVKKIISSSFGPGSISGLSENTQVKGRQVTVRGGLAYFDKEPLPTKMVFQDPVRGYGFTFALVPTGHAACGIDLQPAGGAWQGRIVSDYAPGYRIKPQETLEADPLFVAFGNQETQNDINYSWMLSLLKWPAIPKGAPRSWVTVPDTEDFNGLKQAAKSAEGLGIHYALIPGNWEGRPGSLEGGAPRYPKDIAKAAKELRDAGFTPGLTIDPLAIQGGDAAWTAKSADGQTWANPAHPDAASFLLKRMQDVAKSFGFLVVEKSRIPDEVLAQFGVSRAEADWRAVGAVSAAAQTSGKSLPVYPAQATALKAERDAWLEAASATCRMAEYSVTVGPVRFDVAGLTSMDEELAAAIRLFPGVIEVVGSPAAGARSAVAAALAATPLRGRPQDAARVSPLLWQIPLNSQAVGEMGVNLLAFSGAGAWTLKDLEVKKDTPAFVWRPDGDSVIAPANGEVGAANQFTVYGVCPELTRPTFMGVSDGYTFGLDRVSNLIWNEEKGLLSVTVDGIQRSDARGYVRITPGWTAKSVKVGGNKVKSKSDEKWVVFPAPAGAAQIEVQFDKGK